MKTVALILVIAALTVPALAADDPAPAFFKLSLDAPQGGLKDQVGSDLGDTFSFGYVFRAGNAAWGKGQTVTWAVKMDLAQFENGSTQQGAYSVGLGIEGTHYFQPNYQGVYLDVGFSMCDWALTSRNQGVLQNINYVRPAFTLGLGYRFNPHWGLEFEVRDAEVDQNFNLSSLALTLGRHW